MNARHALAAVLISTFAATPALATVLSASGQAVGTKSSKADYLRVTEVQKELNGTMEDINDAAVANGPLSAPVPASDGPYILQQKEGESGQRHGDNEPTASIYDDEFDPGRLAVPVTTRGQSPSRHGGGNGRHGGDNGRHGGGNGRHGGGAHATPEPSTWMLLGVGLAVLGGYAVLRRRTVV